MPRYEAMLIRKKKRKVRFNAKNLCDAQDKAWKKTMELKDSDFNDSRVSYGYEYVEEVQEKKTKKRKKKGQTDNET